MTADIAAGDAAQLRRFAIHESAHAVIGHTLDRPLGVISIRPTLAYEGVCAVGGTNRIHEMAILRPLVLQLARPRRYVETEIRVRLAGPAADRLAFPGSGHTRDPQIVPLDTRPNLPPAAAAQLRRFEDQGNAPLPTFIDDTDYALSLANALVGPDLNLEYYAWALADTERMVIDRVRSIERLADELLDRHAMAPHAVRALLNRRSP